MNDSEAVLALKAKLKDPILNDGSDWASHYRKRVNKQIRYQRLVEARERGGHTPEDWIALLEKYGYRCVRCGCFPDPRPCKDHIVPIYQGGCDSVSNLQPLCRECNSSKGPDTFNWAAYRDTVGFDEVEA